MPCHHVQHVRNVGPILFMRNENIAHVMPCGTTDAMMSCAHHMVHTPRQASHPMYTWCARSYLWMYHLRKPNDIYGN